jgi:hypothetical protein
MEWNRLKLTLILMVVVVVIIAPLTITVAQTGTAIFPAVALILWPFLNILVCLMLASGHRASSGFMSNLVFVKYVRWCPLLFYLDRQAQYSRFKQQEELMQALQPGDIILRRHDNYLDTLILGQTSYFTHAAIFYGEYKGKPNQIFEATGQHGVAPIGVEEFLRCDDALLLRFAGHNHDALEKRMRTPLSSVYLSELSQLVDRSGPEHVEEGAQGRDEEGGSVFDQAVYIEDVRKLLESTFENYKYLAELLKRDVNVMAEELRLFDRLVEGYRRKALVQPFVFEEYIEAIKSRAEIEHQFHRQYDFAFNFTNFDQMSCVEYVWFCYKCLFPLHQIGRRCVRYFNWMRAFVLVPDLFLECDLFEVKFPHDIDQVEYTAQLKDRYVKFWWVIAALVGWQWGLYALAMALA